QYAEIIYFQRGTKLYRRVRLILPSQTLQAVGNTPTDPHVGGGTARNGPNSIGFATNLFEPFALFPSTFQTTVQGNKVPFVSWQGLNDLSARPSSYPPNLVPGSVTTEVFLSTLVPLL